MIVRLLKDSYLISDQLYNDFIENAIINDLDHFSEISFSFDELNPFPIYINYKNEEEREKKFFDAINCISKFYLSLNKDITMSQQFWQSLFLVNYRDYVIENYPNVLKSKNMFKNVLLKPFDWENYIYKCLLAVEYITDLVDQSERDTYYTLILKNLDLYNYLIKYTVFRNDSFIVTILNVVNKLKLGNQLKAKIKDRPDLGNDERYGRRVIFEFNKDYPVVLSPMMSEDKIESLFISHLNKYINYVKI